MEDASAHLRWVASGSKVTRRAFGAVLESLKPDEELCNELGLPKLEPEGMQDFSS